MKKINKSEIGGEDMEATMELLIMQLRSEVEEIYLTKEFKEKIINNTVKESLHKLLDEKKISSTEYQEALDILKRYEVN